MTWVILLVLALAMFLAVSIPEFQRAGELEREKERLEQQVREQEQEHQRLLGRMDALRRDPRAVENAARDRLKLAKPDETIFRFQPDDSQPASSSMSPQAPVSQKRSGNP